MFLPARGGALRMRGKWKRPSLNSSVRWVRVSMARCFLMDGKGTGVRQSRGRHKEVSPRGRGEEDSCTQKAEREG